MKTIKDLSRPLCDAMSSAGNGWQNSEEIAEDIVKNCHRTEMQDIMRFCMALIGQISLSGSDLRNEASVNLARKIIQTTGVSERVLPRI